MSKFNSFKAKLLTETSSTKSDWEVEIEGYKYFYTEVIDNSTNEVVSWTLQNEYERDLEDVDLLKLIQECVNASKWDLAK